MCIIVKQLYYDDEVSRIQYLTCSMRHSVVAVTVAPPPI